MAEFDLAPPYRLRMDWRDDGVGLRHQKPEQFVDGSIGHLELTIGVRL
jgi:hypothetical protein